MSTATAVTSQSEIISRAMNQRPEGMTPEAARFFLSLQFATEDVRRMNELAEKACQGSLDDTEQGELDEYRRSARFVDILKLRARLTLQQAP